MPHRASLPSPRTVPCAAHRMPHAPCLSCKACSPLGTAEQLQAQLRKPGNIRNVCVVGHVDHGKTTLVDSLIAAAGSITHERVGDARALDTRSDERQYGITIKSKETSLVLKMDASIELPADATGDEFLVNVFGELSPCHNPGLAAIYAASFARRSYKHLQRSAHSRRSPRGAS